MDLTTSLLYFPNNRSVKTISSIRDHISQEVTLKEPLQVRAKGCGKRLKGGKEKGIKKPRRCTGCGLSGQSHDKRNYPKLLNAVFGRLKGFIKTRMKFPVSMRTLTIRGKWYAAG
ncbi:hypothetical protein Dimus_031997 [Dionaea muscipula]